MARATANEIIEILRNLPVREEQDSDPDELASTGPGGSDDHKHMYDISKDGETSVTTNHAHPYRFSDDTTGPGGEDSHVHALEEHDELEA